MTNPSWRAAHLAGLAALITLAGCATPIPAPRTYETPKPATPQVAAAPAASAPAPAPAPVAKPFDTTPAAPPVVAAVPQPVAPAPAAAAPAEPPAPAPVPVDPLQPEVPVVQDDRVAQADLWARVRRGFAMPDLDNERVRDRERWYASRPDYVQRMTERGSRYLFHIVEELERRQMPTELALLPFIESAFNPQAMSSARASGMWQFIPSTGRTFALKQNLFRDDRRDVLRSTRAALDYLQKLHGMFGDWHLALAAYNWGEGNVQRAVNRNRAAGLPTDYDSLRMPGETQYYIPKLQAVKNIVARPEAFSLTLPALANHPYFLSVPIERDIDVDLAARLAGLPLDEFKSLNPQMNKPVILAAGTPQVLLPYDNANRFARALPQHRGPLATWTAWVVPRTLRPADAAKQVGMAEASLRQVNAIPPRMLVRAGSTLLVPRGQHRVADVSEHLADNAVIALAPDLPPMRKTVVKAGKRDSVVAMARRYKVNPAQLAHWNGTSAGATFKPGQKVVVYVPVRAKAGVRTAVYKPKAGKAARAVPTSSKVRAVRKR